MALACDEMRPGATNGGTSAGARPQSGAAALPLQRRGRNALPRTLPIVALARRLRMQTSGLVWHAFHKGRIMYERTTAVSLPGLLATALLVAGCGDALSPERRGLGAPEFATAGTTTIVLDQLTGKLGDAGTEIWQNFQPTNPHVGDAIIATFSWPGSPNTID